MTREPTPLMQQYREIKRQHPGAILFFRMGDFYEMFYDDAELAARVLGLTLTSRNNGGAAEVPLAGVPVKAGHEYLRRLVQQGYRVAVCEQVEDPRLAKGVVRREVIETVTPGAAFSDDLLESDRHNYMCALLELSGVIGIAAADVSIGTFRLIVCEPGDADDIIARLSPREVIVPREALHNGTGDRLRMANALVTEREPWEFDPVLAREELVRRFRVAGLDGLGISSNHDAALGAAGALLRYLSELQPSGMPHLMRPSVESTGHTMPLDEMTRRNLELIESLRGGAELHNGRSDRERSGTLLGVLDRTLTPMGARKLREWILAPLLDRAAIDARLDAVGALKEHADVPLALADALDGVRDVERLAAKAAAGRATPRDLGGLRASLAKLPNVEAVLRQVEPAGVLQSIVSRWDACREIVDLLSQHLVDRPPLTIGSGSEEGETIRGGVDQELDELRALRDGGRDAIAQIQAAERLRTGIASLKVGYNKVFGYFIEVTNANKHLIPSDYQRRQTLTGAERYVTPALKEYEERVLTATERIEERERELFETLRRATGNEIVRLQAVAVQIATLDVLLAFAVVASREGYVRPEMTDEFALNIVAGRHPVVERMMSRDTFIPNDVSLTADARMIILTGPNMAGKSTILRQVGLIVLLAQIGSFVPAARATIGIVDRLFTRVGASDNLVRGQSTFMVEMAETSAILHAATSRSLVLLDEIGRGTSTYDGVSIAWAVSEHVHDKIGCKTIFATHYHELTQLADELGALRNYNVAVREVGDEVLFLHRLQPGPADRSYGIEVGRLAGLPEAVIRRARAVLSSFEGDDLVRRFSSAPSGGPAQLSLFPPATHPVIDRLKDVRTEEMTPLAALQLLDELASEARS